MQFFINIIAILKKIYKTFVKIKYVFSFYLRIIRERI